MTSDRISLGLEIERHPATSRWLDHVWRSSGLRFPAPDLPAWTLLDERPDVMTYHAGTADVVVRSCDTQVYKDNLEGASPSVYVVFRRAAGPARLRLYCLTVDPTEAHAHADVGDDLVEALPMPEPIRFWLSRFVTRHHVERRAWKRKRDSKMPKPTCQSPGGGGRGG
jgi:hypothetical protein